jgi:hypothetical protein
MSFFNFHQNVIQIEKQQNNRNCKLKIQLKISIQTPATMSEFSDHASSPTSFVFENLHDVDELFDAEELFDLKDKNNVHEEKQKKISFQEKSDESFEEEILSAEIIDIDVDVSSKIEIPEKSVAADVSTEKDLIEERPKSNEKTVSSKDEKPLKQKSPKPKYSEIVSASSSEISPKIRQKRMSEKSKTRQVDFYSDNVI